MAAWLMWWMISCDTDCFKGLSLRSVDCTGFGICKDFHGDIEFFYAIMPDIVKVYSVPFGSLPEAPHRCSLKQEVEIEPDAHALDEFLQSK